MDKGYNIQLELVKLSEENGIPVFGHSNCKPENQGLINGEVPIIGDVEKMMGLTTAQMYRSTPKSEKITEASTKPELPKPTYSAANAA